MIFVNICLGKAREFTNVHSIDKRIPAKYGEALLLGTYNICVRGEKKKTKEKKKNNIGEALLLCTHNICFRGEIRKKDQSYECY